MAFVLRDDGRANRARRERDQHIVDDRVAGLEMETPAGLQPAEGVTRFREHGAGRHEDPSGSRKRGLDALHETAPQPCFLQ
jgi:hypothetical protein